jgi:hypothetical protein
MRRVALLVAFACGAFSGCFEPPILPSLPAESGAAGEHFADAGEGGTSAGSASPPTDGGAGAMSSVGSGGKGMSGSSAGSSSAAGSSSESGSGGGSTGITWLELDGDRAPGSAVINAELGIEGHLYAYRDDCASLEWVPETRCATGKLCRPGPDFENWGVAVGFDFKNTGPMGDPPNTKLVWDPRAVGVKGFAWRIKGSAPAVQVWVLNMAPSFGGACAEETCEIAGPPDGDDAVSLLGQLLLSNMRKDDWAGSGDDYDFDPARVHALQIKLPAVRVDAPSFSFCVEALGVVR